jgi:glycogen synthase
MEWERLRQRAVALDFSWARAAERYEALYGELMTRVAAA